MRALICVLPGDGIGPEVTTEALGVLEVVAQAHGHTFEAREALIGGAAIDATGSALPPADTIVSTTLLILAAVRPATKT